MYINNENVSIEYERLKSLVDKRKTEFNIFINKLENETSWLTSPASTKFHLCMQKGLLIHSVGVASKTLIAPFASNNLLLRLAPPKLRNFEPDYKGIK